MATSDHFSWKDRFSKNINDQFHHGLSLHRHGQVEDAENIYRQILSAYPTYAGAWQYLGVIAIIRKQYAKAMAYLERSLQLDNSIPEWHNNYGVALREIGRIAAAIGEFRTALQKRPDYADAWSNYGNAIFLTQGVSRKAISAIQQALKYAPDHPDALLHLADMMLYQKKFSEARKILEKLQQVRKPYFLFVEKMAHAIVRSESTESAIQYVNEIMEVFPSHQRELTRYLGCLYGDSGKSVMAKQLFRKTCISSDRHEIWRWKHLAYCPTIFEDDGSIQEYWNTLHSELDMAIGESPHYDWQTLAHEGFCPSFNLPHLGYCCRDTKEKFDRFFANSFPDIELPQRPSEKRIRVGFLVTPEHEGGFLRLVSGIIKKLNRDRFEPFLFYHEMTEYRFHGMKADGVQIVTFNWNFTDAVRKIRETQCDVIYYWKAGEDVWSQFFAMARLAPIQCTSWGTHGTSGIHHMDYYVSWNCAEVFDAQKHYTEKLYLLSVNPNDEPIQKIPPPESRIKLNLPERGAIYFCPHRLPKYQPCFDSYLRGIMEKDPSGHIVLLAERYSSILERLQKRMSQNIGETLYQKLIFLPSQSVSDYYRYLSAATVVLHSPIYSGEITWVDSMLYGVPGVSQTGELLIQRYGTAYSRLFGLSQLAAINRESYINEAVRLGTEPSYRHEISQQILSCSKDFFDTPQTTHAWELFLEHVVRTNSQH